MRAKTIVRILCMIGWLAAPKKGHLPFPVGVWTAISCQRSEFVRVAGLFWRLLVSAALVAMPDFVAPPILAGSWMFVKWIAMDAAEYVTVSGTIRYRVGLYTPVVHRVFDYTITTDKQYLSGTFRRCQHGAFSHFFRLFSTFGLMPQNVVTRGGGRGVCFSKSVRKRRFRSVWVGGGIGDHIFEY